MNMVKKLLSGLLLAGVAFGCSAVELKHWPADAAAKLNALVKTHANKGEFAVFDMYNTSYNFDLEESLLPYM